MRPNILLSHDLYHTRFCHTFQVEIVTNLTFFLLLLLAKITYIINRTPFQIGKSIRLFIVDGTELAEDYPECQDFKKVFINPEIIEESEEDATFAEGCLSLPGISENVIRPASITIRYLDENFTEHTETYDGFAARIIQHEYDHLEGHVFTDRISPIRRQFVKTKLTNIAKGKVSARYRTKR